MILLPSTPSSPGGSNGDIQYNNNGDFGGVTRVPLANGGTNVDLSASGSSTAILAQDASHVISARALVAGDLPNHSAALITSGLLALARGGTNADLSATGGASQFLKQVSVGAAVTVAQPAFSDISGTIAGTQLPELDNPAFFFGGLPIGFTGFTSNGSSGMVVANRVQVIQFYLSEPIVVRKVSLHVTTGSAATTANIGIYDSAGTTLLIDSGSLSTATSATNPGATLGAAVHLVKGWYFYAIACTSLTPTFRSLFGTAVNGPGGELLNLNRNRMYIGGNSLSGGVLPSSIGTVTLNGSQVLHQALFES